MSHADTVAFADAEAVYQSGMLPRDTPRQAVEELLAYARRHRLLLMPGMAEAMVTTFSDRSGYRLSCTPRAYCRLARQSGCYRPGRLWFEQQGEEQLAFATCFHRDRIEEAQWSECTAFAVYRYHYQRLQETGQAPAVDAPPTGHWRVVPLEMLALIAELRACKRAVEHLPVMSEHRCDDDSLDILFCR